MAITKATASSIAPAAKGDLVVGSGTNDAAVLAVGTNGDTLVADSAQSTGLRYNPPVGSLANPVINGGMDNWQRGTSISVSASTTPYTADRWQISTGANQASTVSRQATGDTTNLPNIQYCARVQRNSGQTGTGSIAFVQSFETTNCIPFANKTVTVSFYARKGADYSASSSYLGLDFISGTGTDQNRVSAGYTGNANVFSSGVTLTTSWQRFAITGTISATATEFATYFIFTPTGTASTNDYFELTGVQIDVGTWTSTTAPTFRRSGGTLQGELAACQRYYVRLAPGSSYGIYGTGYARSTTAADFLVTTPVQMRVAPTSVEYSGLTVSLYGTANYTFTALSILNSGPVGNSIYVSGATGLTQFRPYFLGHDNSTTGYLAFSAEL